MQESRWSLLPDVMMYSNEVPTTTAKTVEVGAEHLLVQTRQMERKSLMLEIEIP